MDKAEPLNEKDKLIHDAGLVSLLKQIHDDLDRAVLEAYGWYDLANGKPLADRLAQGDEALEQEILTRLVALNHERAAEEAQGTIRWLRPEYQCPEDGGRKSEVSGQKTEQQEFTATKLKPGTSQPITEKLAWPKDLPSQVAALRNLIPANGTDPAALAAHFGKRTKKRLEEINQILTTLENLGQL